jgi:AcrR family transcriptional regulator
MNKRHDSGDTKENILIAAREILIRKGYDGTKMEDIAKKAGVSKIMLYYHFKSKENILKELIGRMIDATRKNISGYLEGMKNQKTIKPEMILEKLKKVIGKETPLIRIIISEVLRGKLDYWIALSLLRDLYDDLYNMRRKAGISLEDRESCITKLFFFQGLPLIMYFCTSEYFGKVYGIEAEKMEAAFSEKFADSLLRTLNLN